MFSKMIKYLRSILFVALGLASAIAFYLFKKNKNDQLRAKEILEKQRLQQKAIEMQKIWT